MFEATDVVITKEMEEEEKQLMEEGERKEQEMMIKVSPSLISPLACPSGYFHYLLPNHFMLW